MNTNAIKAMAVATVIWTGLLGSAHAYLIDWGFSPTRPEIGIRQTEGTRILPLLKNQPGWNRMVSAWQSFTVRGNLPLGGVSLQVRADGPGSVDLNIYEGVGVQGKLVSWTKLEWDRSSSLLWYTFKLGYSVFLLHGKTYTFALENVLTSNNLYVAVNDKSSFNGKYLQQELFGGIPGIRGYSTGASGASINFILVQ